MVVFTEFISVDNPISNRSLILPISRNEKDGKFHNIIQPNLYVSTNLYQLIIWLSSSKKTLKITGNIVKVRVYPNGDVLYSIRVTAAPQSQLHLQRQSNDNDKDKDKDKDMMCSAAFFCLSNMQKTTLRNTFALSTSSVCLRQEVILASLHCIGTIHVHSFILPSFPPRKASKLWQF